MAGIGFKLRAIARKGDGFSAALAYTSSMILVAGPWIFTVLSLLGITYVLKPSTSWEGVQIFRSAIVYNFAFTLILVQPLALLLTRYLADQVYRRDLTHIPFALFVGMSGAAICSLLVGGGIYLFTDLSSELRILAVLNFMLVGMVWILLPFLSILQAFGRISLAFMAGNVISVLAVYVFSNSVDASGILAIYNLSLLVIVSVLLFAIFSEYDASIVPDYAFIEFLKDKWKLPVIGVFYYLGIWIDKLIVWHTDFPGQTVIAGTLATAPLYDTAMFLAQLTAIPVMAAFFVHSETRFFEKFRSYFEAMAEHASRTAVQKRAMDLGGLLMQQLLIVLVAQAAICSVLIVALPVVYPSLGLEQIQLGMFRLGLIGTMFHSTLVIGVVYLLYFDMRNFSLAVTITFFVLNGVLTTVFLPFGVTWLGLGYAVAGGISLAVCVSLLMRELPWLVFHTFVSNNVSIKRQ